MNLAKSIEHTLLRPDTSKTDIKNLCEEAIRSGFYSVSIPPYFVQYAASQLKDSKVIVSTVIGYPFGYSTVVAKVEETKKAINDGAMEIDMVANTAAIRSKDWSYVKNDIESVTTACHMQNRHVKVIIETSYLNEKEITKVCELCNEARVNFVKNTSGYGNPVPDMDSIRLLRQLLQEKIKIVAGGAISSRFLAEQLLSEGAERIGCTESLQIIEE
jgi:deoxyribose-phosphate aldolase